MYQTWCLGWSAAVNSVRMSRKPTMQKAVRAGVIFCRYSLPLTHPYIVTYKPTAHDIILKERKTKAGNEKTRFSSASVAYISSNIFLFFFSFTFQSHCFVNKLAFSFWLGMYLWLKRKIIECSQWHLADNFIKVYLSISRVCRESSSTGCRNDCFKSKLTSWI